MDNDFQGLGFLPGVIIGIVIAAVFWGIGKNGKYEGMTAEDWFNEYDYCTAQVEQANINIEEAKYYTWSSYNIMGEALENLETVEQP